MIHQIVRAVGRPDFTVELEFAIGEGAVIDLASFVAEGVVTAPLRADPQLFCSSLRIVDDGDAIGWPGDVEIDADALWYKVHPEDWERDYGLPGGQRVGQSD
jgi:hypothetical protein